MKLAGRIFLHSLVLTAAGAVLLGCKSLDKPASASFASVQIAGYAPEKIRTATLAVFAQEGYSAVGVEHSEIVFEKEGSQWDRIAYGNWIDDNPVCVRVRVGLVPLSAGAYRLQCQAFRVRDKGDTVFENEVRLRNNRSKPFQKLLDNVLGRLRQQGSGA